MNSELIIIPPKEKVLKADTLKPINVCAYCRVSTDEKDQKNSLVAQKGFFQRYFNMHFLRFSPFLSISSQGKNLKTINTVIKYNGVINRA